MFYGRKEQINDLMALWNKRTSSLVTCRGRRRIGKSTLIETFAERSNARLIRIEGLRPTTAVGLKDQLANFAEQLTMVSGIETAVPNNWLSAFTMLDRELRDDSRTVVLLDEISWMASGDKRFPGTLKIAWDTMFKKHPRLILVICGSVSMWIKEHIIDDSTFYGRRSLDIVVPELSIADSVLFWGKAAARKDRREILDILSVTGGIPRYLEEIDPGATANENIRRLGFRPKSVLRDDFDQMFQDVITKQPNFTGQVIRALISGPLTIAELAEKLGLARNGHFTEALEQLEEAGLVSMDVGRNPVTGEQSRVSACRLSDNYSRFYLKYIEPVKATIDSGDFRLSSLDALDGWESIKGLAFENLVVNHSSEIIDQLGYGNAQVVSIAPYRRLGSKDGSRKGVQVDLLVQSRRSICLVEIKRQREIGREVITEMQQKVAAMPKRNDGTSIRTALIYEGNLAPIVEADGYFDVIIPFRNIMQI